MSTPGPKVRAQGAALLVSLPELGPPGTLRRRDALAASGGNRMPLTAGHAGLPALQVDVPESAERRGYRMKFVLEPEALVLQLADYQLHQCLRLSHAGDSSTATTVTGNRRGLTLAS